VESGTLYAVAATVPTPHNSKWLQADTVHTPRPLTKLNHTGPCHSLSAHFMHLNIPVQPFAHANSSATLTFPPAQQPLALVVINPFGAAHASTAPAAQPLGRARCRTASNHSATGQPRACSCTWPPLACPAPGLLWRRHRDEQERDLISVKASPLIKV